MTIPPSTPPEKWTRVPGDLEGVPLWKRDDEACFVATGDMDLLRFIDVALARFDWMTGSELHDFMVSGRHRHAPGDVRA